MKKLKSRKGFTLIEMIACVLTLVMVTMICTVGLNMAMKSYNESLFESGSQMLESMINTSVGDVLRYSFHVTDDGAGNVTFSNENFDVVDGCIRLNTDGHVMLVKNAAQEVLLIGSKVYTNSMYVTDFFLSYDSTTSVYNGSYKIKSDVTGQEKTVNFTYKSIIESI